MKKLDTESYKGVRDFYPEDMWVMKWMFHNMRKTVEEFGYVEYGASVLEPAELYMAKSGEEIVNEQTYTFTDRGDRKVTLRPEMTPTVARMIAGKRRELGFPVRWYSIPNLFRYEAPQKGRLREHWQLNVDMFGKKGTDAEIEIISVASHILTNMGAKNSDFIIQVNSRPLMKALFDHFSISEEKQYTLGKLIDKKEKIDADAFVSALQEITDKAEELTLALNSPKHLLETLGNDNPAVADLITVLESLSAQSITNVQFTPTLMRGFDYYTGIVFEIFDTNPENRRSLFGGGRYDNLTELFDNESIPAMGFGMGDVTLKDFLSSRNLIPQYVSEIDVAVTWDSNAKDADTHFLVSKLRQNGIKVAEYGRFKQIGDFYKYAEKNAIPFTLQYESTMESGLVQLITKNTKTREAVSTDFSPGSDPTKEIAEYIKIMRSKI